MTQSYSVTLRHQGATHSLSVSTDETVLHVALSHGIQLPCSCEAGVCTTCAAKIVSGSVDQSQGLGIAPQFQKMGYALLCVSHPLSDLVIETEKEDEVYQLQFGKQ